MAKKVKSGDERTISTVDELSRLFKSHDPLVEGLYLVWEPDDRGMFLSGREHNISLGGEFLLQNGFGAVNIMCRTLGFELFIT